MFNVVLYEPEIPANTGNIGRTCVVAGARLHLIKPLGFSLQDDMLKRAGLGYWHSLDVTVYENWQDFLAQNRLKAHDQRLHLLTKKARRTYAEGGYQDGDFLVFGKESAGLPEELLASMPERCERIPMLTDDEALSDADEWHARDVRLTNAAHANKQSEPASSGASTPAAANASAGCDNAAAAQTPSTIDEASASPLLRQDICGNFVDPDDYRISALNLSNSAAIVLYEALRQTGFPGM